MLSSDNWFPDFQDGREAAFKQVFDNYYRPVSYFATKILGDEMSAEDLVAVAFKKAWDKRATFKTAKHLENFLYLVTRNDCLNYLRGEKVRKTTDKEWAHLAANDPQTTNPGDLERVQSHLVKAVFQTIHAVGGDVLRMNLLEHKTIKQIASELGTTENAVYIEKSRGLKRVKDALKSEEWKYFVFLFLGLLN